MIDNFGSAQLAINCAPRPRRWKTNIRLGRLVSTVAWLRVFCIVDRQSSSTPTRPEIFGRVSAWRRGVDDASIEKRATFMARLQQSLGRKHGFWGLVKP